MDQHFQRICSVGVDTAHAESASEIRYRAGAGRKHTLASSLFRRILLQSAVNASPLLLPSVTGDLFQKSNNRNRRTGPAEEAICLHGNLETNLSSGTPLGEGVERLQANVVAEERE